MTTSVDNNRITITYGIGIIRKRIDLSRVRNIEPVRSPWYYGWGIRFIPNGMLHNISGSKGVELWFNDTERIIRIGTKKPEVLKGEIEKRIN